MSMSNSIKFLTIFNFFLVFACFDSLMQAAAPKSAKKMKSLDEQLFVASANGDILEIQKLIQAGADLNFSKSGGFIALHNAARKGHAQVIQALIQAGTDPNAIAPADRKDYTPLHLAAMNGFSDAVKTLLAYGANVNQQTLEGNTALHLFLKSIEGHPQPERFKSLEVAQNLLAAGADLYSKNKFGENTLDLALEIASRLQNKELKKLFLNYEELKNIKRNARGLFDLTVARAYEDYLNYHDPTLLAAFLGIDTSAKIPLTTIGKIKKLFLRDLNDEPWIMNQVRHDFLTYRQNQELVPANDL